MHRTFDAFPVSFLRLQSSLSDVLAKSASLVFAADGDSSGPPEEDLPRPNPTPRPTAKSTTHATAEIPSFNFADMVVGL